MDYRVLGRTGVKIAPIALGTANFADPTPEAEAIRMIERALDAGINLIDTGDSYAQGESEQIIGRMLTVTGRRHDVVLATKTYFTTGPGPNDGGGSRLRIVRACEESLRRLNTDYIDLYQIHRPDPLTAVEETLGALTDLVRQGKIRYVGCSTHPAWKVMEALMISELKGLVRYSSEQPPYNLLDRRIENELIPLCQAYGLGVLPWSPMAMGILAGHYRSGGFPANSRAALRGGIYADRVTPRAVEIGTAFVRLAERVDIPPAQLALLWVKDQPGVTAPIAGPRTLDQLEHLLPVLEMQLSSEVRAACDDLVPPGSAVANFHNSAAWMRMQIS
jgi:aryl-alcohol dehydrogenase-like predicted oxidoreductase